jgi:hypothetical protein
MVSVPAGALLAMHDTVPPLKLPVQSSRPPVVKSTLPLGVPPAEVTVAERVTADPKELDVGATIGAVDDDAGVTVTEPVPVEAADVLSPL